MVFLSLNKIESCFIIWREEKACALFWVVTDHGKAIIHVKRLVLSFLSIGCIVFELSVVKIKREFPAESSCKASDLTRYKVDTACRVLTYISTPDMERLTGSAWY